jgi:choline dehydrogenase
VAGAAVFGRLKWHVGTVVGLGDETPTARTIALQVPDWPGHVAGQRVDLRVTAGDGYSAVREYSIASAPRADGRIELSVERLPDGEMLVSGVVFKYKGKMPDRLADSNAVEAEVYLSSGPATDADINLVLEQLPAVTPETAARFGTPPADAFTIAPALVQPTSRGSVRLASNNVQDAAVIEGNPLGTDSDFAAIVRAIEAARELGSQHAFDCVRDVEVIPGPKATADDVRKLAVLASASFGHPVGTCKIGVDTLAVVDPQLRVHGLQGLRVADASVMPRIITGPTNAPTHMIAGRAAQLIPGRSA